METNFNESCTVLISKSVDGKKLQKIKESSIKIRSQGTVGWMENKKEVMLAGKEDKRIGRIRKEINMADDGIRKRKKGI